VLPFDDIMEFALALLSLSPTELDALGWTFADRKLARSPPSLGQSRAGYP
jgi:hypothetical protein